MDELQELRGLVDAYNQAENEQSERLRRIFGIVVRLKGYSRFEFSNGRAWSNLLPRPAYNNFVTKLEARIVHYDTGQNH